LGKTSNFSALVRYQSLAMGLTVSYLFFRLAFAFHFLIYIVAGRTQLQIPKLHKAPPVIGNFMRAPFFIIFLILTNSKVVYGQSDSSSIFESSKGTWDYPVTNCIGVTKLSSPDKYLYVQNPNCTFFTDSSSSINAVFDGLIVVILNFDEDYLVMTKFGEYSIFYYGLTEPKLKRGDFIKAGQLISFPTKGDDNKFRIEISLSKESNMLDPFPWFAKKKLPITSGFVQLGQDQQFFSFSPLPGISYGVDR